MSWFEYDEERKWAAIEVLKHGPVPFRTGENEHGKIYPTDIAQLIRHGYAEEYRENGVTWLRLKETESP
jgi:hypothetical protein